MLYKSSSAEYIKYINIVIRRPQYGKTSICMETIQRQKDDLHIILTMNTIKANKQFFDRCNKIFNNNLCIFNSKKPQSKNYKNFNDFNKDIESHATNVLEVRKQIIDKGKNIIIACCHHKRFQNSIQEIINLLEDSKVFNKMISIHIDEIHEYVNKNRYFIEGWNNSCSVKNITGYSATPFKTWGEGLWENLYIVDTTESMSDPEYFGVKDAIIEIFTDTDEKCIEHSIPDKLIKMTTTSGKPLDNWYTKDNTYFNCGDEHLLLCFVHGVLSRMIELGYIQNDKFTYNFIPGYKRKITHLGIADIIEKLLPFAIIIIFNGDNIHGNRYIYNKSLYKCPEYNETVDQIVEINKKIPNRPIFITGLDNVMMSITLVGKKLGNFDNVVLSHKQYIGTQPDILYQLCRFMFRYSNWEDEYKKNIKETRIWCDNLDVIETCQNYEQDVIKAEEMGGSLRSIDEVTDKFKKPAKRVPESKKHDCISKYVKLYDTKEYPVYDKSMEDNMWKVVKQQYINFKGIFMEKSIPYKNDDGFYQHSFSTTDKGVYTYEHIKKKLSSFSWHSNYQLIKNHTKYARIYVGYKDINNPNTYTIFLRTMELEDNDDVNNHLSSLKKN